MSIYNDGANYGRSGRSISKWEQQQIQQRKAIAKRRKKRKNKKR